MRVAPIQVNGCQILVGTSGFSYPEWVASGFYPPATRPAQMLSHYSQRFPVVELNYTWYQMAHADALERMLNRVPAEFFFTAKLTRSMTHEIDRDWPAQAAAYVRGMAPLHEAGRLLAVLIQLPPSFCRTPANRRYLGQLTEALAPLPLAVEFRHRSWAVEPVVEGLRQRDITLVAVDAPDLETLFPPLAAVTSHRLFYLRLHGRNLTGWRSGRMEQKFDYSYAVQELRQWLDDPRRLPALIAACQRGVIVFNNHVAGQAVDNAMTMAQLLGEWSGTPHLRTVATGRIASL